MKKKDFSHLAKTQFQNLPKDRQLEIAILGGKATLGNKHSEETKKRMSIAMKNSKKHKDAMRNPDTRRLISKRTKDAISQMDPKVFREFQDRATEGRRKFYDENPKVKKEDLIILLESDKSVTEIIYELGVSFPTYYKYKKQYGF